MGDRAKDNNSQHKSKYPKNWKGIVKRLKYDAENECELCGAENYKPHWKTGSKVVLTVHHCQYLDCEIESNSYPNLIVLCQRCHLRLDLWKHTKEKKYQKSMFCLIQKRDNE